MRSQLFGAGPGYGPRLGRIKTWVFDEAGLYVAMFLYLWVFFGVFVLEKGIVLRSLGYSVAWQGFALVNALVLAKVMLVAEHLELGRWLPHRPLIWRILHDALLLSLLFICFHFGEQKVVALLHRSGAVDKRALGGGLLEILSFATILFVSLVPFFAFRHLAREIGEDKMYAILFGARRGEVRLG